MSTEMTLIIVGAFFVFWFLVIPKRRPKPITAERQRDLDAYREQVRKYEDDLALIWPVKHVLLDEKWLGREYLLMSVDQRSLCHVRLDRRGADLIERFNKSVDVTTIVTVDLQVNSETVMTIDAKTKKNGSLVRAAAGGIIFGGAGAVVGATSAGSTTTSTATSKTITGPIYLIAGTTDLHQPMMKVRMNSLNDGEVWLRRIQGAIAVASR